MAQYWAKSKNCKSTNTELTKKITDLVDNARLLGYEIRDLCDGTGRSSSAGSVRSGSSKTQNYTSDLLAFWQEFDRLFKEKQRFEKRTIN
ncbi:9018_t:CDS:2, partial [Ambispora gerdemannii]